MGGFFRKHCEIYPESSRIRLKMIDNYTEILDIYTPDGNNYDYFISKLTDENVYKLVFDRKGMFFIMCCMYARIAFDVYKKIFHHIACRGTSRFRVIWFTLIFCFLIYLYIFFLRLIFE